MVMVAPLRIASGVLNKILEAMAIELPIMGTTPAFQGLAVAPQHGMYLADDPGEFADAVVKLLDNPEHARACGVLTRQFITAQYDWSTILQELEQIFQGVTV
jgi:glycosyltransferase involved in cell wall biosynthesis